MFDMMHGDAMSALKTMMIALMTWLWIGQVPPTDTRADNALPRSATADARTDGQVRAGDKKVGVDSKGRTLYAGPRGGRYYIDEKGKKHYVRSKTQKKPRAQKRE